MKIILLAEILGPISFFLVDIWTFKCHFLKMLFNQMLISLKYLWNSK